MTLSPLPVLKIRLHSAPTRALTLTPFRDSRAFFTALDVNGSSDGVSWVVMFNRLIEKVTTGLSLMMLLVRLNQRCNLMMLSFIPPHGPPLCSCTCRLRVVKIAYA